MNDFEQYAKETLNHYPTPVDEERLWGNIEQALREDKRRPPVFWPWWLGFGLVVATGVAAYYWYGRNTPETLKQPEQASIATETTRRGSVPLAADASSVDRFFSPRRHGDTKGPSAMDAARQTAWSRQTGSTNISGSNPSDGLEPSDGASVTIPNPSDGLEPSDGASATIPNPSDGSKPSDGVLPTPAFLPTLLEELASANKPAILFDTKTGCSNWSKGPAFRPYFGLYGGAQYPLKTLTAKETEFENIVAARIETETVLEGIAAGGYIGLKHRSGMFAEGGLEYNRINERFDRTTVRSDTIGQIAVIGIIVNAPGDTTFINDSIHVVQETRTMKRTYNNYRFLQVPLALGFEWRANSHWTLYGKAGIAFNFRLNLKAEIMNLTGTPEKYISEED